ncbi:tyrosine--tRNA ligase [Candidatus Roizmanbacteria bacterium RIFCSPHIGHO2_12_FULL_38_13]|nr:MAG: tyrosine--tRNA ligase [Candidatus Roizmanbacteria bacterium RIFCSPHIGHO2_12_FULL_38_13]
MTLEEKLSLIKQVGEEIVTEEDLKELLKSDEQLIAYDGFEPSGQMHIAQGILRTININKMTKAGIKFKMWVADWHALTNNKLGGDLNKIKTVGKYFIEVWKACGMDLENVEFHWASDMVKNPDYWQLVINVGRTNKLARFIRTAEFMGREESAEKLTAAQIIYPCMQIADIFMLGAKITQLGMDQRKVNMLAREIGPQLGYWKPVVVSHHMLMSLATPPKSDSDKTSRMIELKMSKSNPEYAVFMTDTTEYIKRKINKAWAPEGVIEENPVLEYCKYIIFPILDDPTSYKLQATSFDINRPAKWGGPMKITSYDELIKKYAAKEIHPQDLKNTVAALLDKLVEPVRKHFEENEVAKKLLETVQSYKVTR